MERKLKLKNFKLSVDGNNTCEEYFINCKAQYLLAKITVLNSVTCGHSATCHTACGGGWRWGCNCQVMRKEGAVDHIIVIGMSLIISF